jgi:hypothetical protein
MRELRPRPAGDLRSRLAVRPLRPLSKRPAVPSLPSASRTCVQRLRASGR